MGAPRSRRKPRRREVKPPERPLSNDLVTIFVTFRATGQFEITFAPYRKVDSKMVATDRFPILALSVLRTQLLEVHRRFWCDAKLPVNPTVVSDHLVRPGGTQATHRQEYVKELCERFNVACQLQDTKAVMVIGRPPQPKPAKKAAPAPKKSVPAKKVVAKKTTTKKATKAVASKCTKATKKTAKSVPGKRAAR